MLINAFDRDQDAAEMWLVIGCWIYSCFIMLNSPDGGGGVSI